LGYLLDGKYSMFSDNCAIDLTSNRNISIQLTSSRTFTVAPYHWKIHSLGLLSISGFVGAVISFFIGGKLIDFVATRMTARKGGHAEPEYRLPAMVFPAIIGPMGVLTFGLVIANKKSYWGAAVGFAMLGFGLTAASNVVVSVSCSFLEGTY
jgi:hypothetical protein